MTASLSYLDVKMASSAYSTEYLVNVVPDSDQIVLLLTDILHSKDISLNKSYTTYYYYSVKYNAKLEFAKYPMNGTAYIYYI